jgi:hypothetical protein
MKDFIRYTLIFWGVLIIFFVVMHYFDLYNEKKIQKMIREYKIDECIVADEVYNLDDESYHREVFICNY